MKKVFCLLSLSMALMLMQTARAQQFNYDAGFDSVNVYHQIEPSNGLSEWPMYHNMNITFSGRIFNYGINNFDTLWVHMQIMDDQMNVLQDTTTEIDFTGITTGNYLPYTLGSFTSPAKGTYHVHCYTEIKNFTDENALNDTVHSYFTVTDSTFAHDYTVFMPATSVQAVHAPGQHSRMGQKYTLVKEDILTGVTIKLYQPILGDSTQIFIYGIDSLTNSPDSVALDSSGVYYITQNDTSGEAIIYLAFANGGKLLTPGSYCIAVAEFNNAINLEASNRVFKPMVNFFYYDFIGVWASNESYGVYEVYAIEPHFGCTLEPTVSTTTATCGLPNGSATISYINNTGVVTYLWSNGTTDATAIGLLPGSYTCTVSDEGGCLLSVNCTIPDVAAPVIDSILTTPDNGVGNGSATCFVTTMFPPLFYLWGNGSTTNPTSNLSTGVYTVIVTDANGCTDFGTVVVPSSAGEEELYNAFGVSVQMDNANQTITLTGAWYMDKKVIISIIDIAGKEVYFDTLTPSTRLNHIIRTGDIAKGMYNIIVSIDDTRAIAKVMIQ